MCKNIIKSKMVFQKILKPSYWIFGLNLIFPILIFIKYIDFNYEDAVYRSLFTSNLVSGDSMQGETKTFKNLLNLTFKIQSDLVGYMNNMWGRRPFKYKWLRSGDTQLLDATGSCGSFSHVLAELCQAGGYPVKMVQLKYKGQFGGHNIIEAFVDNKWVAADGLFKIVLYNSDSSLASLEDIQKKHKIYINQFPVDYPYVDAFTDYRYTNWDKIPIIMPAIKVGLSLLFGNEFVNKLSLRVYFLNLHKSHFYILIFLYFFIFIFSIKHLYFFIKYNFKCN
jgi:hypothetical protein